MKANCAVTKGFSLVEVVLALGIVSFCLLSVVGLLPVGLAAVKNGNDESAASNALTQVASAIRNAKSTNGIYSASGPFSGIAWTLNGATNVFPVTLALSGQPTGNQIRMNAHVEIIAPADNTSIGRAKISVAWPASAVWSDGKWVKAEGSVSSGMIFLPQ